MRIASRCVFAAVAAACFHGFSPRLALANTWAIYVMNADGANREWICEGSRPQWSPDGDKLVMASGHEGFASLYVYDTVSLERTRVLARGYDMVVGGPFRPMPAGLFSSVSRADRSVRAVRCKRATSRSSM